MKFGGFIFEGSILKNVLLAITNLSFIDDFLGPGMFDLLTNPKLINNVFQDPAFSYYAPSENSQL